MIIEIKKLSRQQIKSISLMAKEEGYNHMERLIDGYESQQNRFNAPGEKLIGYTIDGQIVAVCGLNIEPENESFARIRRLYVLPNYRKQCIGSELVKHLINHATTSFLGVTVNIGRLPIDEFYQKLGFLKSETCNKYSHLLKF